MKRYNITFYENVPGATISEDRMGFWTEYSDSAALEAEVERLEGELEAERNNNKMLLEDHRRAVQRRHDMIEAVRKILVGDNAG